jgi:chaperone required for assembly of F1-ATPase
MKRFYKTVTVAAGNRILLDGRPVKTPGRADLAAPTLGLAEAIAAEWSEQGEEIDPRLMAMTGLANAAIDRIGPEREAFARGLAAYGESDLLCYRAEGPAPLVARQAQLWDPILAWARSRYDVEFEIASGVMPRKQPEATLGRFRRAVLARDAFALAGLSHLVTVSGSVVIGLALAEGGIDLETAWAAAVLDEQWQAETWGTDAEAEKALAARRTDFEASCRFLSLL